ncbi:sugar phosphate isomerase/epimerase family protein [Sphingobium sp. CAP-1]|uniref:sugar phosphate isomerase/epimerase family protein n=1 Tax=Sphingobium sp. CAP-1 TaxID=2676077 RepID=UPI0012BB4917|nr:sugar phosphate isomerase/epimerase [Sphingobium sp. CAP-1]QGP80590.1 TIM barrel protein [Sphingobium sp. CAP-1]
MNRDEPALIATCWTTAGNVRPDATDNLSRWSLEHRIEAAARAGYRGFGLWLGDLARWRAEGGDYAVLRRRLSDAGIGIVELEYLSDWFAQGEARQRSDAARTELFRAADALGARHAKVMPPFGNQGWDRGVLAEQFTALCADAARYDVLMALEMIPFSDLPDLPSALDMVMRADAANGGLLIDIWHVVRSGAGVAEVADIPARFIMSVELCDADLAMQGNITEDTMRHRRLCGEGQFDLPGFVGALRQAGYDGPFGVEILSDTFRALPLNEAAERSFEGAARLLRTIAPIARNR